MRIKYSYLTVVSKNDGISSGPREVREDCIGVTDKLRSLAGKVGDVCRRYAAGATAALALSLPAGAISQNQSTDGTKIDPGATVALVSPPTSPASSSQSEGIKIQDEGKKSIIAPTGNPLYDEVLDMGERLKREGIKTADVKTKDGKLVEKLTFSQIYDIFLTGDKDIMERIVDDATADTILLYISLNQKYTVKVRQVQANNERLDEKIAIQETELIRIRFIKGKVQEIIGFIDGFSKIIKGNTELGVGGIEYGKILLAITSDEKGRAALGDKLPLAERLAGELIDGKKISVIDAEFRTRLGDVAEAYKEYAKEALPGVADIENQFLLAIKNFRTLTKS